MAEKQKYQVNRSMLGDKEYGRGDTREMTEAEAEAAGLLASGALSKPGEEPAQREPAVQHTFGAAPAEDDATYTSAVTGRAAGLVVGDRASAPKKAASKATGKSA